MVIDAHEHYGMAHNKNVVSPVSALGEGSPVSLRALWNEARVDHAIIMPMAPAHHSRDGTASAAALGGEEAVWLANMLVEEAITENPGIVSGLCYVNPRLGDGTLELVKYFLSKTGFCGINLNPHKDAYEANDLALLQGVMHEVDRAGMAAMIDSGYQGWSNPLLIGELAAVYPGVPVVITHMGTHRFIQETISVALEFSSVHLDTSGAPPSDIETALAAIGPDRIIFGSDAPWGSIAEQLRLITKCVVDDEDRDLVLSTNARRIYGGRLTLS
jgi:predicted TIM-barrel fold metal-dependent hydrolase